MMEGTVVVPIVLSYNVPCDLCHKPFKRLYPVKIDNHQFVFCSGNHAGIASSNWDQKKKAGIEPGIPVDITMPTEQMIDSELPDEEVD